MKRRLVLIRHAKAAQGGPDFDRPLAPRGRADAADLGQWLTAHNIHPDLVVVSPSRRTRETWELAHAEVNGAPPVDFDARVYEDTLDDLLAVIHDIGADVRTVVVVGHNPALQELAVELDGFPATPAGFAVVEHLPTSGVVVLDIDEAVGWPDVVLGTATVSRFASPGVRLVKRTRSVDIAAWRLQNLGLAAVAPGSGADVVRRLLAVQSQDYAPALWSLSQRNGLPRADLARRFADGEFLRTHVLRPTWHFVVPADIRWLIELTGPRVEALMAHANRRHDLTPARLARAHGVIVGAIGTHGHLTRAELRTHLATAGIDAPGEVLGYLLMNAELALLLCSGTPKGAQPTYALLADRAPLTRSLSRDEALGELARRFVQGRGPVTIGDLAAWASLPMAQAARAMDIAAGAMDVAAGAMDVAAGAMDIAAVSVDRFVQDDVAYWVSAGSEPPARAAHPVAHLLPTYDELICGYRPTRYVLDPVVAGADRVYRPIVVVGTRLVGHWKRTVRAASVSVQLTTFGPLSRADLRAVQQAVERFARYLGLPAELELSED